MKHPLRVRVSFGFAVINLFALASSLILHGGRRRGLLRARHTSSGALRETWCSSGKLLPAMYLLGAQKAATSSLAWQLRTRVPPAGREKETHFFEKKLNGTEQDNETAGAWLQQLPECPREEDWHLLGDYTPAHLRLVVLPEGDHPTGRTWGSWMNNHFGIQDETAASKVSGSSINLPRSLQHFYAQISPYAVGKLTFVVMLREPLARMQSVWYQSKYQNDVAHIGWASCFDCQGENFSVALDATMSRQEQTGRHDDWLWGSMYGWHMQQWLKNFEAKQFYTIPFSKYVKGEIGDEICEHLSHMLEFDLECSSGFFRETPLGNTHEHPPVLTDTAESQRHRFQAIISEDKLLLIQMLADGHSEGMGLAGFRKSKRLEGKTRASCERRIESWLNRSW